MLIYSTGLWLLTFSHEGNIYFPTSSMRVVYYSSSVMKTVRSLYLAPGNKIYASSNKNSGLKNSTKPLGLLLPGTGLTL